MSGPIETDSPYITLAPGSKRSYGITWREVLPDGVSVSSLAVTSTPSGLTVGTPSVASPIGSVTLQVLANEAIGNQYVIDYAATWSDGQIDVRTLYATIAKKS